MTKWAILATGPSITQEQVDYVKGKASVIAVSDAYNLAPWADILLSADLSWWEYHRPDFSGEKYNCKMIKGAPAGTNSGALAVRLARQLGAKEIILIGFDGHGSHFFGPHPSPLKNTNDSRRAVHLKQHELEARICSAEGVRVVNCSPGTSIKCYPLGELHDCLY